MRLNILCFMLLAACATIAPETALRLTKYSPLTADPAGFEIAADLPPGIDIRPGTARLSFDVTRRDTGESARGLFVLERAGGESARFAVASADLPALRALQATARRWKAESPDATKGAISLSFGPCTRGAGPAPDARIDVAIRLAEGDSLMPLLRGAPIAAVAGADWARDVAPCG